MVTVSHSQTAVFTFIDESFKARTEKDALVLLDKWKGFQEEPWWVTEGSPWKRLSQMRDSLTPWYLSQCQDRKLQRPSPTEQLRRREARRFQATLKESDTTLLTNYFSTPEEAEKWSVETLNKSDGNGLFFVIRDTFRLSSKVITKQEAHLKVRAPKIIRR